MLFLQINTLSPPCLIVWGVWSHIPYSVFSKIAAYYSQITVFVLICTNIDTAHYFRKVTVFNNSTKNFHFQLHLASTLIWNLKVEDSGVILSEALIWRNHSVQQLLVQSQTGNGGEQPAVSCQQIHDLWGLWVYSKQTFDFEPHCCRCSSTVTMKVAPCV